MVSVVVRASGSAILELYPPKQNVNVESKSREEDLNVKENFDISKSLFFT